MHSEQTEERPMSDRPGLSIFDDPDENGGDSARSRDDEATQVIPAVRQQSRTAPTPPSQPSASTPRPDSTPAAGSAGGTGNPGNPGRTTFPVVRRGGYDPASVDRQMHTLAGEKAGLTAGLNDAKARVASLEKELASLRSKVSEHDSPTYA